MINFIKLIFVFHKEFFQKNHKLFRHFWVAQI